MRRLLIVLLTLGAIGGFAAGFARLWHHHHYGHGYGWHHGERLEQRVADICVRAAERRLNEKSAAPTPPVAPPAQAPAQ